MWGFGCVNRTGKAGKRFKAVFLSAIVVINVTVATRPVQRDATPTITTQVFVKDVRDVQGLLRILRLMVS